MQACRPPFWPFPQTTRLLPFVPSLFPHFFIFFLPGLLGSPHFSRALDLYWINNGWCRWLLSCRYLFQGSWQPGQPWHPYPACFPALTRSGVKEGGWQWFGWWPHPPPRPLPAPVPCPAPRPPPPPSPQEQQSHGGETPSKPQTPPQVLSCSSRQGLLTREACGDLHPAP